MSSNATLGTGDLDGSTRKGPGPQGANLSCCGLEGRLEVLGGQRRPPGPRARDGHAPPRAASAPVAGRWHHVRSPSSSALSQRLWPRSRGRVPARTGGSRCPTTHEKLLD